METNEFLVAAKAHDDYLLALDEAKRWWDAEDSLSAVIDALADDGEASAKDSGDIDRWARASVVFGDDVIVGLREYLIEHGRALPLDAANPEPEPTPDIGSTDTPGPTAPVDDGPPPTAAPVTTIADAVRSSTATTSTKTTATPKPTVAPKDAAAAGVSVAKAGHPQAARTVDWPKAAVPETAPKTTAPPKAAAPNAPAVPTPHRDGDKKKGPGAKGPKENVGSEIVGREIVGKKKSLGAKRKQRKETAWSTLAPAPGDVDRPKPTTDASATATTPVKSARWANTLIVGGSLLLLVSLIGGLLLLTRNEGTTDNLGTAPSVVFSQCGPERAVGEVTNPGRVPATLDVVVEFSDGDSTFFPVAVRLDVDGGSTATINVPATGSPVPADALACVGFVSNFQPLS